MVDGSGARRAQYVCDIFTMDLDVARSWCASIHGLACGIYLRRSIRIKFETTISLEMNYENHGGHA